MITVIYEDTCAFCNWCRRFVEARATFPIQFVGYDTGAARELLSAYPELYKKRTQTIILFAKEHVPLIKFKACCMLARHMRTPWPTIATALGIVPVFLGDLGYDLIARMRPLLSGLVR